MQYEWTKGRYRWRTRLRAALPSPLWRVVHKGRGPCGDHQWYRSTETVLECYHCYHWRSDDGSWAPDTDDT